MNTLVHAYDESVIGNIMICVEKIDKEIYITYSDAANGIKNEYLNNSLEPFFTTGKHDEDTGLGLSIIYNIITQILKGTLSCNSLENDGTTFIIRFPAES
jgi:signal transduction histidine kinase